jgi:acetoin utilization deacetylase AcuC-like enzyme
MTWLVYDPIFLAHDTGPHPECAARLEAVVAHLQAARLWDRCEVLAPRAASDEELLLVHTPGHVARVKALADGDGGALDVETLVSPRSFEAASRAAGAALTACDRILAAGAGAALALVRPPGHHATPDRGMGFCLFNTVAIAARYLRVHHGVGRVLIVDWDAHHGNGTQEVFYSDPTVHYFSMHRAPFYPGTGWEDERGRGPGLGATTNVPLRASIRAADYLAMFARTLEEIVPTFRPEFVLVSAGFDSHRADPIGGAGLDSEDFARLTHELVRITAPLGRPRIVSVLEGGYSLEHLPLSVAAHLRALLDAAPPRGATAAT